MAPEDFTGRSRDGRSGLTRGPSSGRSLGSVVKFETRRPIASSPTLRRPRKSSRTTQAAPVGPDASAARLEALHRQAGALAHDFNNLLGVIVSANEALSAELEEGSERRKLAEMSLNAAEQGAALLRRLLDLAHEEPTEPAIADCATAVEAAARFARHAVPAAVAIALRPQPEPLACAADPADLESALLNLCINAGDAMAGEGLVEIEARGVFLSRDAATELGLAPGPYVRVAVIDDGAGMSPDVLARAAEPFFTTKRGRGGTGLGLAGVDAFARRCAGALKLDSALGLGTSAVLYLPRVLAAS